jgi:hypothetical protein
VLTSDGFVRVPRLIGPTELERLRAGAATILSKPLPAGCERPHNTLAPLRWCDPPVATVLGSTRITEALISATGARDLRWTSGYVSVKDPASPPLWWHQDWWCWDHPISYRPEAAQVAVLCYLVDASVSNGALRILPGSHRRSVALQALLPAAHEQVNNIGVDDPALGTDPDEVTLETLAGDAVVIDYRLLHATHANSSGERRTCLILNFAPAWNRLPRDIRAHLIQNPGLPALGDRQPSDAERRLLPAFDGQCRDLSLNRIPPTEFAVA